MYLSLGCVFKDNALQECRSRRTAHPGCCSPRMAYCWSGGCKIHQTEGGVRKIHHSEGGGWKISLPRKRRVENSRESTKSIPRPPRPPSSPCLLELSAANIYTYFQKQADRARRIYITNTREEWRGR